RSDALSESPRPASSSNVRSRPETAWSLLPPTSDISSTLSPPGPTSTTPTSSGYVCENPWRVTSTSATTPAASLTSIALGYGTASPASRILIAEAFAASIGGGGGAHTRVGACPAPPTLH